MRITVLSRKGGVGKTVTAVHLAAYLARLSGGDRTLLVDTDPSRNALAWSKRGGFPFEIVGEEDAQEAMTRGPEHVVVDVKGSPDDDDVKYFAVRSDVLVVPTMPSGLSLDTLLLTINDVTQLGRGDSYKVLMTAVPPWPHRRGPMVRAALEDAGVPLFGAQVRRLEAFETATKEGVLVSEVADRRASKGWGDYERVGDELVSWVVDLRTRDLRRREPDQQGGARAAG